jgi:hypothetical protein
MGKTTDFFHFLAILADMVKDEASVSVMSRHTYTSG